MTSVDETEASYATATPSNTGLRYTKEPTSKEIPANSADGDLGVDSGLGYLVEDDRSSEEEDAATKEKANLAQGFVIEEDSSGSEASYSEVTALLQPSHSSDSFEDQPRPLVQIPGRDSASSHVSKFGKEEPWELQMDDSDDYEEEEYSDEWALAPLESINRKALTMDTSNQLVLYRPDSDRERSKQKAIMDTSYERSSDSHTWPVHGSQKNADASNTGALYLTWQPDESEGGKFADKTPPASLQFFDEGLHPSKPPPDYPPPFPVEHQDEYQKGSQSTTSSTSGDLFSGDNLGGPEKVLAAPSHEQQPSKATSEMPTQRNMQGETSSHACEDNQSAQKVTDKAILRTLTIHDSLKERPSPKKSRSPNKRVRWGWMTVEKISRDLSDHEDLDKSKKSHHAEKQATVEDVEDATETKSKHQQQQDLSDTDFGSGPSASVSLSMEPLEDKESVSSAPGLSVSPKSTKARARSQKREKKQASQSSKTKEAPKAANQGPAVTKRVPKPAESPTLFMEEARKAGQHAKSIATSQMSSGTKQALAGYNINRWVDHTNRLLERYCARGSARAVRTLLEQKCNPGTAAKPRRDPLLNAIRGASARHSKVVRLLLDYGVDVHIVAPRHYNKTPLHLAIENKPNDGYVNMVHDMVFARVDPNAKDRNGECALEKIFKGGGRLEKHRLDALALLLLSEADDGGGTRVNIRVPATRDTPLHLAVRRRSPMAAAMLLHRGADVNAANASGMTPLLAAALTWRHSGGGFSSSSAPATMAPDDEQMLDLLTSQPGVRLDGFAGTQRRTALHHAVVAGLPLAVEILLEKKADPRQPDADGKDAMALVGLGREEETADDEAIRRLLRDVLGE
ncbi:hypothetical protein SLS55_003202 [Diplodia seriata]|uniref:Ankyrin repeat protein n=1 Tax=Diplodia seriata TaxID=420778 RepID=A0ABR3CMD1_9PEZI